MRRLALILALLLCASSAHATATFVDGAAATPGVVSSGSFTISHTLTAGNFESVCVVMATTTVSVSSVTDDGGSVYIKRNAVSDSTSVHTELWTTSGTGIAGSPTTITVNISGTTDVLGVTGQFSGVAQVASTKTSTGSSTAVGLQTNSALANGASLNCAGSLGTGTFTGAALKNSAVDTLIGGAIGSTSNASIEIAITTTITLSGSQPFATNALELQATNSGVVGGRFIQGGATWTPSAQVPNFVFDKKVTAGNMIVVCSKIESVTPTNAITDTLSNTYTGAVGPITDTGSAYRMYVFYAKNITGGADTVTDTNSGGNAIHRIAYGEYSQANTSAPLDKTANGTAASTAAASGGASITDQYEMIYGCVGNSLTSTFTAGSGYTIRSKEARISTEDQIVGATGSYDPTMTVTSGNWLDLMISTIDATQASPPTPQGMQP